MIVRTLYVGHDGKKTFRDMALPEEYTALEGLEKQIEDMKIEISRKADKTALESLRETLMNIGGFSAMM